MYSFFKKRLYSTLLVFFLLTCNFFAASTSSSWVLAAEKFSFTNKSLDSVNAAIASLLPTRILDSTGASLFRNIQFDEAYARTLNSLKTERQALFLQLSGEVKKRDVLLLENYDKLQLKKALKTQNEKIKEIEKKLEENLETQRNQDQLLKDYLEKGDKIKEELPQSELDKYATFFKSFIFEDKEEVINEQISFYKNDISLLYEAGKEAKKQGYTGSSFEKEMLTAKINGLITGQITAYEDYIYVAVSLYVYPGAKYVTTVSEVGTLDELDFISESLGQQLIPYLTNSMPISLIVNINPEAAASAQMYIDGNLIQNINNEISLDSGVHFIKFSAENYKSAETSYFFSGNKKYLIEVNLREAVQGQLVLTNTVAKEKNFFTKIQGLFEAEVEEEKGSFYVNGIEADGIFSSQDEGEEAEEGTVSQDKGEKTEEGAVSQDKKTDKAVIKINGDLILGQFISENGQGSFFYIPADKALANQLLYVETPAFNRNDYIEKHRRKMYNAYSGLIISLIPFFVTKGQFQNYSASGDTDKARVWNIVNKISSGISVSCGVWFVYELVRYFKAADSVIPNEAEIIGPYEAPLISPESAEENTNIEEDIK